MCSTLFSPVCLESVYFNQKSNLRTCPIHQEIRFNPTYCFIQSSIFYWKPLFKQTLTYPVTLFYHIWLKQYSKEREQKRWETRRRRAGDIAFVYQNNKRNESVTLTSNNHYMYIYIFGKWMEKVTYMWKIKRSRPWTFHAEKSLRLRAISHLYWCSNSEIFVDVWLPWKNPSVNF